MPQTTPPTPVHSSRTPSIATQSGIDSFSFRTHWPTPIPTLRKSTARPSVAYSQRINSNSLPMSAFPVTTSTQSIQRKSLLAATLDALQQSQQIGAQQPKEVPELAATTLMNVGTAALVRIGVVVDLADTVDGVLAWRDPSLSLIVLVVFIGCCLYPIVLVILPQILLSLYIFYRYVTRPPAALEPKASNERSTAIPAIPKPSNLQTLLTTAIHNPEKLARNLHFMQQQSIDVCKLFDAIETLHEKYLSWQNPEASIFVLKALVFVGIPVSLGVAIVLPGWVFQLGVLCGGVAILCGKTFIARVVVDVLPKVFWKQGMRILEGVVKNFPLPDSVVGVSERTRWASGYGNRSSGSEAGSLRDRDVIVVEVFENQRWWAGPGWTATMLDDERSSWSDESGVTQLAQKSVDAEPPLKGHQWVDDSEWQCDTAWTTCDDEGWVYTDHQWNNPSKNGTVTSLTRRRRWIRKMVRYE